MILHEPDPVTHLLKIRHGVAIVLTQDIKDFTTWLQQSFQTYMLPLTPDLSNDQFSVPMFPFSLFLDHPSLPLWNPIHPPRFSSYVIFCLKFSPVENEVTGSK